MRRSKFSLILGFSGFFLALSVVFNSFFALAQDSTKVDTASTGAEITDSTGINKTTKYVISELKEAAGKGESTWLPVIMILLVLCVVGFALWLSFRGPSTSEKRRKVMDRQRRKGTA